jgi:hypothetical protein
MEKKSIKDCMYIILMKNLFTTLFSLDYYLDIQNSFIVMGQQMLQFLAEP